MYNEQRLDGADTRLTAIMVRARVCFFFVYRRLRNRVRRRRPIPPPFHGDDVVALYLAYQSVGLSWLRGGVRGAGTGAGDDTKVPLGPTATHPVVGLGVGFGVACSLRRPRPVVIRRRRFTGALRRYTRVLRRYVFFRRYAIVFCFYCAKELTDSLERCLEHLICNELQRVFFLK